MKTLTAALAAPNFSAALIVMFLSAVLLTIFVTPTLIAIGAFIQSVDFLVPTLLP